MILTIRARAQDALRDQPPTVGPSAQGKVLAWAAVTFWALCLGLGIQAALSRRPIPPIFVAADPKGGFPILIGFRTGWEAESSGLQVGDRLVRIGGRDLAGAGPLGLFVETARAGRSGEAVDLVYRRGETTGSARLRLAWSRSILRVLPNSVAWALLAILLLSRSAWTRAGRYAFGASIGVALTAPLFGGNYLETSLSIAALSLGASAMTIFGVLFSGSFLAPRGGASEKAAGPSIAPVKRWPWIFAVVAPFEASRDFGVFLPPAVGNAGFVGAVAIATAYALGQLTTRARRAAPIERRQLFWVLFGLYWGAVPIILAALLAMSDERFVSLFRVASAFAGLLPLIWIVTIFRFNMLGFERFIGTAATYSLVVVSLFAVGIYVDSLFIEGGSILGEVAIAAALIALSIPGHRWLKPVVERVLFPERLRIAKAVAQLERDLSGCTTIAQIWERVGNRLYLSIDPLNCSIYGAAERAREPLFHRGMSARAPISPEGGLVPALADRAHAFHLQPRRDIPLTADERTALQTLQAAVVVPIRHRGALHAFLVLGDKQSEDIYTAADLAALDSVSRSIAEHLARLEESPRS